MTLTTAKPAKAGIYWQAAIFTSFGVGVEPDLQFKQTPDAGFNLVATPTVGMLGPQKFTLHLSPCIAIAIGTEETTSFGMALTPRIGMGFSPDTAFTLTVFPVIGMAGKGVIRGRQVNTAVTRSATH